MVALDIAAPRRDPTAAHGRPRPLPAEADETHSIESDVLDGNMTPADLAYMLENLNFRHGNRMLCTVRLDREVARYLARVLRR
jgi:hypothetical protein